MEGYKPPRLPVRILRSFPRPSQWRKLHILFREAHIWGSFAIYYDLVAQPVGHTIESKTGVLSRLFGATFLANTAGVLGGALRLRVWAFAVGIGSSTERP